MTSPPRHAAPTMHQPDAARRSFLKTSAASVGTTLFAGAALRAQADAPLIAYVGTFSSPLRDVLPTQVDLPPGNGRGIHRFRVDRATGALTPAGVTELGTSPSCLAVNAAGTRLYSANETDRVGDSKEGTVSAFAVDRADGQLRLLNTVPSGGAGPTYVSLHPSGRFVLVANYFGGSVAVLPVLADGRLGAATDVKIDAGAVGPARATNAPKGSFAYSGHDRHARAHGPGRPRRPLRRPRRPGPRQTVRLEVRRPNRHADRQRPALGIAPARRRAAPLPLPPERQVALLDSGGSLDRRPVRLRRQRGPADAAPDDFDAPARVRRQQFLLGDPRLRRRPVRLRRQPPARRHRHLRRRPRRRADLSWRGVGARQLPAQLRPRPDRPLPHLLQPALGQPGGVRARPRGGQAPRSRGTTRPWATRRAWRSWTWRRGSDKGFAPRSGPGRESARPLTARGGGVLARA